MKKWIFIFVCLLPFLGVSQDSSDQKRNHDTKSKSDTITRTVDDSQMQVDNNVYSYKSQKETWLSISVLLLFIITLGIEAFLIYKKQFDADAATKLILVSFVTAGTLFLFVAGYSDKQIAPAFGLFGTICGYVFGKSSNKETKDKNGN